MNGPPNILIIEPDQENRNRLSSLLQQHGFLVTEAATGTDGVGKAAVCLPDLIILETELSDTDGYYITEKIRKWSELPILVLSECQEEKEIVRVLDSGADDYVKKPYCPEELLARIRAALRRLEWRLQASTLSAY